MEDKLTKFNEQKKQSESKVIIGAIVIVVGVLLGLAGSASENALVIVGIIIGMVGFIFIAIGSSNFSKIKKTFKEDILAKMFQEIIPGINYKPNEGLSPQVVYDTDFLKRADRFHSEDFLSGELDGVEFISSDVKLEERHVEHTKNGTRVYYVAYFIGRVFRFSFNKDFVGSLYVLESGSPRSRGLKRVKLESIDFNKKFKTYSSEEITAFYILTPDIMEAIHKIERRNPGRIGFRFHGEHLFVAINNNRDTFELKMFKKIDDSMIEEFKEDLYVIKDFIVTLKLNNNLFKK
ncbi:MAG: hypothetical protein B6I17_02165 [Tenericutes bacterium 4572_104]|nr:MAG: hypothetical protein B6I17_02165 [Tenericutes bacterium 4572_104]